MKVIALALGMATAAVAVPHARSAPRSQNEGNITIFSEQNFRGENTTFAPDVKCHSLFPWIESVRINSDQNIYCQLFDNIDCDGEGGDVIVGSQSKLSDEDIYPGIMCGVLKF